MKRRKSKPEEQVKSLYENACRRALDDEGFPDVPWQVLEAVMRDTYGCLDALRADAFRTQVKDAVRYWYDSPESAREYVRNLSLPEIK